MNKKFNRNNLITLSAILILLYTSSLFAATDYLADLFADIKETAGHSLKYIIYLAELVTSVYAYTQTKQIAVLAGLPLIILFTNYGFRQVGI